MNLDDNTYDLAEVKLRTSCMVPGLVFERYWVLAKALGISRQELFERALTEWIQTQSPTSGPVEAP